ncbi:type II toxin-antitoxin system VapC family toxin [Nonomuraea sp. NPDC050663]|uniref:type II toxin-antitoxin system VapC family toxin n=1 Tax=Nonomuraea sp. NPDC050663 TaxID=3364370 RepID=UPI00378AD430
MTPIEVAPARGVVDTNVIILMEHLDATELPEEIVLTTVTMAELSAGPHYTADPVERAARIERIHVAEALFETLPFDSRAARRYGQITAAVLAAGRNPRPRRVDLLIAAIASAHRLPLYTVNPKDFAGLEALLSVFPVTHPG